MPASLLGTLLRNPQVWAQVIEAIPVLKDVAGSLYQGSLRIVDDLRQQKRKADRGTVVEGATSLDALRNELMSEIERVEARALEQAALIMQMTEQLALLTTLIRSNQSRSILGMYLSGGALVLSTVAIVVALSQ